MRTAWLGQSCAGDVFEATSAAPDMTSANKRAELFRLMCFLLVVVWQNEGPAIFSYDPACRNPLRARRAVGRSDISRCKLIDNGRKVRGPGVTLESQSVLFILPWDGRVLSGRNR